MKINDEILIQVKVVAEQEQCEPEEALNNMLRTMLSFQYLDVSDKKVFVGLCLKAAINKRFRK